MAFRFIQPDTAAAMEVAENTNLNAGGDALMTLQPWLLYALSMAMVLLGLLFRRRGHYVHARGIRGSAIAGEINGSVTVTNTEPYAITGKDRQNGHGDRIGWGIAVVGVLVATAQFAHDVFGFLK